MTIKREKVTGLNAEGKPIEVAILRPGNAIMQDAQMAYSRHLSMLIRTGAGQEERLMLRSELEKYLNQIGAWTTEDQSAFVAASIELRMLEEALRGGGMKLSQGRAIAIQIQQKRKALMNLYSKRVQYDNTTAEAASEQYRLQWLMVRCCVRAEDNTPFFADITDYVNRQDEDIVQRAAQTLAEMLFGFKRDFAKNLFEQQWLRKYRFANEDGHLINGEGKLINDDGHLVDSDENLIDDQGHRVDALGRMLDEEGGLVVVEEKPFVDDITGLPVGESVAEVVSETVPEDEVQPRRTIKKTGKKRGRPRKPR